MLGKRDGGQTVCWARGRAIVRERMRAHTFRSTVHSMRDWDGVCTQWSTVVHVCVVTGHSCTDPHPHLRALPTPSLHSSHPLSPSRRYPSALAVRGFHHVDSVDSVRHPPIHPSPPPTPIHLLTPLCLLFFSSFLLPPSPSPSPPSNPPWPSLLPLLSTSFFPPRPAVLPPPHLLTPYLPRHLRPCPAQWILIRSSSFEARKPRYPALLYRPPQPRLPPSSFVSSHTPPHPLPHQQ